MVWRSLITVVSIRGRREGKSIDDATLGVIKHVKLILNISSVWMEVSWGMLGVKGVVRSENF
jgi:hypothetical protein